MEVYSCYCTWKLNTLRRLCHLNDQLIDNQIYLTDCTKTLPVRRLQQTNMVRYCTSLVSTGTTYGQNAPCFSSVFCISVPRLAQRSVFSPFVTFTTPIHQFPLLWGAGRCKSLTPTTLLPSSLARTNVFGCNVFL
jgi:hypothetical protein